MKEKQDYPVSHIRKLLANYDGLAGNENAIIAKADIDRAIDALGYIEKEVITKMNIEGCPVTDLERKFEGIDIGKVERQAICNMAAYLNGECVFERWCRENGLMSNGIALIPDYFPPEIVKYTEDICREYCVLDECPE